MIEIKNLRKRHGRKEVLHDLSFAVEPGRITGFLGPNGAGKSSTLRILLGLDRATSGSALINGVAYGQMLNPMRSVGAMFDGPGASKGRSARDHLRWMCVSNEIPRNRVNEVLEIVGLADNAKDKVGTFSLGMGQRLGIASALLGHPGVLVLDEPTNGLDPDGLRWLRAFLRDQAQMGNTVLVSSHLMTEMEGIADDLVVISDGAIVSTGTVAAVRGRHPSLESAFFALTDAVTWRVDKRA
ncbi:ATP-binding cassette domain-containing protein [Cryobacterium sp. SO2]|uniref:ABC transporter ATP-binding protein n=1 Tax=Cryobacterium sp. SO2 TaxID=1897060 RepID=UPI00223E5528|nr:ATP-binding cassette domain-containing protein [Cryobacterium sp. SO2]WEO78735.1 ATP-binding cassette domain-containing protein [Cryobacterium sp. SO2]